MTFVRKKNGKVCVDAEFSLDAEHKKDMERVPEVVEQVSDLAFKETPTVAVSALITVLSKVLVVAGQDPLNEARIAGDAIGVFVRQHLQAMRVESPFIN